MNVQIFDSSANILQVIIWQYAEASNLVNLLNQKQAWLNENQEQFWQDWHDNVFNLLTANVFGLSVWSYILFVPLYINFDPEPMGKPIFGFNRSLGFPALLNTYRNFGATGGNFSTKGKTISLTLEEQRFLLRLRYFQLYTRGNVEYTGVQDPSAPIQGINNFLDYLVRTSNIGYTGKIFVLDNLDMTITYVFTTIDFSPNLLAVLKKLDILPRPRRRSDYHIGALSMPFYYYYAFAQNADDLPAPIPLTPPGNNSINYFTGWTDPYELDLDTDPTALPIPRDEMNRLFYDITLNLQEYQQYGTPQFITTADNQGDPFPYPIYARVYYSGQVYENQMAANTVLPGTDNSWLLISGSSNGTRTGTIIDYAGITAPFGYIACNGTAISRTTFAPLLTALTQTQSVTTTVSSTITGLTNCQSTMYPGMHVESPNLASGTTITSINSNTSITVSNTASAGATTITFFNWGNGDGSTTFNVPNLNYRSTMGSGGTPGTTSQAPSAGLPTGVVGTVGGESQHTQLEVELAAHNHPGSTAASSTNTGSGNACQTSNATGNNALLTITTDGSSTPFNVIQPTALVLKCIKT